MRKCACGQEVEEERVELLDSLMCSKCAKLVVQPAIKAHVFYNNDGTSEIVPMDERAWDKMNKDMRARTAAHL
jgi:hypothetical protein